MARIAGADGVSFYLHRLGHGEGEERGFVSKSLRRTTHLTNQPQNVYLQEIAPKHTNTHKRDVDRKSTPEISHRLLRERSWWQVSAANSHFNLVKPTDMSPNGLVPPESRSCTSYRWVCSCLIWRLCGGGRRWVHRRVCALATTRTLSASC